MTLTEYYRMRKIEGVRLVELVYVSGLLRMGSDSLLLSVWRCVGGRFTGKGELDEEIAYS